MKSIEIFDEAYLIFRLGIRARNGPPGPMDRPGPGRAGRFIKISGPGGLDVLSGWPGPVILSFFYTFHQLFCSLQMIEIIRKDFFVGKLCGFNDGNIMKSISFLNWSYFSSTCSVM
jgi:hypothetical protein